MAKDIMQTVNKKLKDGWIKVWMAVEVLAVTKDAAESSLTKHIEKFEKEDFCIVYKKEYKEAKNVPNPFEKGKEAYSMVVEIEFIVKRFEDLIYTCMNYAPSGIEILEPGKIAMEIGEAQGVLNSVSDLIHNFAAARRGLVTLST